MDVDIKINDENLQDFGSFMRSERKKKGLTQQELANLCGISVMSVRRYEKGERSPGLDEMMKIGSVLGFVISVDADVQSSLNAPIELSNLQDVADLMEHHASLMKICQIFGALNSDGQQKLIDAAQMISKVPEYQKKEGMDNGNS